METSVFVLEEFAHKNKQFPSVFAKNIFVVQISIGVIKQFLPKHQIFYYNLAWGLQTLKFKIQEGHQYDIHFHVPQYISIFCAIHVLAWL